MEDLVEQLVGVAALGGQHDAVVGQDAQARARVADGLHGVLNLVQMVRLVILHLGSRYKQTCFF